MLNEKQSKAATSRLELRTRVKILDTAITGSLWKNNFDVEQRWKLIVDNAHALVSYKYNTEQNQLNFKRVEQTFTAFTKPHELEGQVIIEFGGNPLFMAANGELMIDDLGITSQDILGKAQKLIEGKGKGLVKNIKNLLDSQFKQEELGEIEFETDKYLVTRRPHQFFIRNKVHQRFVANDFGFTTNATPVDMLNLHQIPGSIQKELQKQNNSKITSQISKMLDLIGESDKKGLVTYKSSHNYYFSQFQGSIEVSRMDGSGQIFNNNGFTELATPEDIKKVKSVEQFLHSYQGKVQTGAKAKESQMEMG
jgi:hypothetical protein